MKTQYAIALAVLSGLGGAAAVQGLHAQVKPPVYLVTEINVTNPEAYGNEFAPKAQATIKAAGGRLIAIGGTGGAGAKPLTVLAGTAPQRLVIQQWDSLDQLKAWCFFVDTSPIDTSRTCRQQPRRSAVQGKAEVPSLNARGLRPSSCLRRATTSTVPVPRFPWRGQEGPPRRPFSCGDFFDSIDPNRTCEEIVRIA